MKVYVFITVDGEATEFAAALRLVPGVTAADAMTGEVDVLAVCEADDLQTLNRIVTLIKQQTGVITTTTRVVIGPPAKSIAPAAVAA
jgi:DNA-binding Lrp family transcriptional regulator